MTDRHPTAVFRRRLVRSFARTDDFAIRKRRWWFRKRIDTEFLTARRRRLRRNSTDRFCLFGTRRFLRPTVVDDFGRSVRDVAAAFVDRDPFSCHHGVIFFDSIVAHVFRHDKCVIVPFRISGGRLFRVVGFGTIQRRFLFADDGRRGRVRVCVVVVATLFRGDHRTGLFRFARSPFSAFRHRRRTFAPHRGIRVVARRSRTSSFSGRKSKRKSTTVASPIRVVAVDLAVFRTTRSFRSGSSMIPSVVASRRCC